MTRAEVLDTAKDYVSKDRNTTAGEPEDNFKTIADFWETYLARRLAQKPDGGLGSTDVAVMMILMKISRIAVSPTKADHWIDIAGYAACGGDVSKAK